MNRAPAVHRITAVGIVVPARDEEVDIGNCLDSVRACLPTSVDTAVCVVLDRCTDDTARHVPDSVDTVPNTAPLSIGAVRDLGMRHLINRLRVHPTDRIWLLNTDADTVVGPSWVDDHLCHARAGAHAVAGLADLADPSSLSASALEGYNALLADTMHRTGHGHVYGANLGIRADCYEAVGGFPDVAFGEDHALVAALRDKQYRLVTALDGRVRTSARTDGRSAHGLASLLRSIQGPAG